MHIFFVGYMGSGKSSLGKRVAKRLNLSFLDMDREIEREFNLSIPEIFALHGEKKFRDAENLFLKEKLKDLPDSLIATGGGVPCFYNNMELMNHAGLTVYLDRPVKELAHRIFHSKKSRPLVDLFNLTELNDFIQIHLEERSGAYSQSQIHADRNVQTIDGLEELINNYLASSSTLK